MSKGTSVKLELDALDKILARRGLQDNGPAQKKAASELKRMCGPYVPMQHGDLKNTAQVMRDGVLYVQPYAAEQYYTNSGHGSEGIYNGGERGKQWDKRMMADHGKEYIQTIAEIIGGEPK